MFLIKKCSTSDIKIIYKFVCLLENNSLNFKYFKNIFIKNLKDKNIIYLKCISDKEVVGFASCHIQYLLHHDCKVAEIQEMYVDSGFRSQGVGKLLIQSLIQKLQAKNVKLIEVTAQKKRKKAHQFYTSNEFKQTHLKFNKQI
jgi:PhnO protein